MCIAGHFYNPVFIYTVYIFLNEHLRGDPDMLNDNFSSVRKHKDIQNTAIWKVKIKFTLFPCPCM